MKNVRKPISNKKINGIMFELEKMRSASGYLRDIYKEYDHLISIGEKYYLELVKLLDKNEDEEQLIEVIEKLQKEFNSIIDNLRSSIDKYQSELNDFINR